MEQQFINSKSILESWNKTQFLAYKNRDLYHDLSLPSWWKEIAGLFILSPRQTGKTTALRDFINLLRANTPYSHKIATVSLNNNHLDYWTPDGDINLVAGDKKLLSNIDAKKYHLIIDEFCYIPNEYMSYLLNKKWKSLTAVSTLK